jgi:hypothetical protein
MYRVLVPVDDSEERAESQTQFVASLPYAETEIKAWIGHSMHDEERED